MGSKHNSINNFNRGRINKMNWYAYKLTNGKVVAKQHSRKTQKEINDLYGSDDVADVIENIEAVSEKQAIKQAKQEFKLDD